MNDAAIGRRIHCHCNTVEIALHRLPERATECNCSICRRYGAVWAHTQPADVTIRRGHGALEQYAWGDKEIRFNHCRHCGTVTHYMSAPGTREPRLRINARLLSDEALSAMEVVVFNGAAM